MPFGHIRMKAKRSNDYLINWDLHKSRRIGIAGVNLQDVCVTENEGPGPIMDRTKEHLCAGDISTIRARLKLLNSAKALREKRHAAAGRPRPERLPRPRRFHDGPRRRPLVRRRHGVDHGPATDKVEMFGIQ